MFSFIARLIVFIIAITAIRSMVQFVQGLLTGARPHSPARTSTARPAATMMKQDPVCGTWVAIDSSLKTIIRGQVIHFCSPECRDKFRA
jgi:YHS domain-containing protein